MASLDLICLIPVHNEASHLKESLRQFKLESPIPIRKFVLCENGSKDQTRAELEKLQNENPELYHVVSIPQADFGLALRAGLQKICELYPDATSSSDQWIQFNGADIPFGNSDLLSFQRLLQTDPSVEMVLGSKFHSESQVQRSFKRLLASRIFFVLRFLMTGMAYKDTQGTLFFKCSNVSRMSSCLQTKGFITTTEMIYWHHLQSKKIREVPVIYKGETRPSSVKIFKSGYEFVRQLARMVSNQRKGLYR